MTSMENTPLLLHRRVRVILQRLIANAPAEIVRGSVIDVGPFGCMIRGRRFQESISEKNAKLTERPRETEMRVFYIPFTSIRYCEVIEEDTESARIDAAVELESPLRKSELRQDASA